MKEWNKRAKSERTEYDVWSWLTPDTRGGVSAGAGFLDFRIGFRGRSGGFRGLLRSYRRVLVSARSRENVGLWR